MMGRKRKKKAIHTSAEDALSVLDTRDLDDTTKGKIHEVVVDSNDTAHRILDTATDARDIGRKTKDELDDQGRRIDKLDKETKELQYQTKKNKRTVRGIRSVFWAVINFLTPRCLKPQPPEFDDAHDSLSERDHRSDVLDGTEGSAGMTILYDSKTGKVAKDTSATLDAANDVVHDLEDLAEDMGRELDRQNGKLDGINGTVDDTNKDLDEINKDAKRYLGSSR